MSMRNKTNIHGVMRNDPDIVQSFFAKALAIPADRLNVFLDESCRGDLKLKSEVLELLKAHRKNENTGFILNNSVDLGDPDLTQEAIATECVGNEIGKYRLTEKIGEGGMGIVFSAQQTNEIRRKVAIKIIKSGMESKQVIARFEIERQALAMFDHPNITRVLDVGTTERGCPYFVMELIDGINLAEYMQEKNVDLDIRLTMFVAICNAVQHAHQKGIIHRDLKPSNILVTHFDGKPMPKVIDFGIAKALNDTLTQKTLFTNYSVLIGTPRYMSPEQSQMNFHDVDTRSDIYSLGIILYEMLTGETPFSEEQIQHSTSLSGLLKKSLIESPSKRISRLENANMLKHWANPSKDLLYRVEGELDWIVLKAIADERPQRYSSAADFAADVTRYLNNEPVLAVAPTRWYRIKKFLTRHKVLSLFSMGVLFMLLISSIVCSVFAYKTHVAQRLLANTVEELQLKNSNLIQATLSIQKMNDGYLYKEAIEIALAKFTVSLRDDLDLLHYELAKNLQEFGNARFGDFTENNIVIEVPLKQTALIDLAHGELVKQPIQRIKKVIEFRARNAMEIVEMASTSKPLSVRPENDNRKALRIETQTIVNNFAKQRRNVFFRLLLEEYKNKFGDSDPHIAEGLDLLGVSLIESGNLDEAASVLRSSLEIRRKFPHDERDYISKTIQTQELLALLQIQKQAKVR